MALCARVGDDEAGATLRAALDADGVDTSAVTVDPGAPTGVALITVDAAGDNIITVGPGANARLDAAAVRAALTAVGPGVVLASLEIPVAALEGVTDSAAALIVNPAPATALPDGLLERVDILVPNRVELAQLAGDDPGDDTEDLARAARSLGARTCVVTLGAAGALVVEPNRSTLVPAPRVAAVDTTAAGDAFCGALADACVRGLDLPAATRWAVRVAAASTLVAGAQTSLPTPAQIEARLTRGARAVPATPRPAPTGTTPAGPGPRPRVLLDCDPGIDDALAILTAARHTDLVGITTVNGNVGIDATTRNALHVCAVAGLDVEVHRGAARPLVAPPLDAARVHGAGGLGPVDVPVPPRPESSTEAVAFLIDTVRADETHLVATGPLTNLALALRLAPDLPRRWASLTVMGGSIGSGNVTPAAEFNIWADPEAAAIVLHEAGPLTLVGLDVTTRSRLTPAHAERLRAAGHPAAVLAAELIAYGIERSRDLRGESSVPMHDATAVMALVRPDLFTGEDVPLTVELTGSATRGATVVDRRPDRELDASGGGVVHVLTGIAGDTVADLVVEAITSLAAPPSPTADPSGAH